MMSHAVVCLALFSVATVSAQYSSYYPTYDYTSYPITSSSLFTDALYDSYGTSYYTSTELYNPFIPIGGAAFGIPVEDEDAEEPVCEVFESLAINNFDTGVDVSRTISYQRTLTCECDDNANPIAETCYRPSDMPSTCVVATYPCDVSLQWDLEGVNFAGVEYWIYKFSISKELECQCNVAGEPDFPTCIDLEAQEAWEEAQDEYELAYEVYLEEQEAALLEYETEAEAQAAAYEEYIESLAEAAEGSDDGSGSGSDDGSDEGSDDDEEEVDATDSPTEEASTEDEEASTEDEEASLADDGGLDSLLDDEASDDEEAVGPGR